MTETKKESGNILKRIWERSESAWDEIKQSRAAKSLRAQAETDLLSLQDEYLKEKENVENAILKAKETKDWKAIRVAALDRDMKLKELESAVKLYEEFFDKSASEFLQ